MHKFLLKLWRLVPYSKALRRFLIGLFVPRFNVGVQGIVFNDQQQVLLFEHSYRREQPWGLPGGFLGIQEQPEHTIVREIEEESGIRVRVLRLFRIINETGFRHLTIIYLCEITGGTLALNEEVLSTQWFSLHELPDILEIQKELIRSALQQ